MSDKMSDPADLWDAYCAETPAKRRSPQGAMAFAFGKLTAPSRRINQNREGRGMTDHSLPSTQ